MDAGWLEVSTLGPLHVVVSRKRVAKTLLGLVTDAPAISAADLNRTYEKRWLMEQWMKDTKQLLGVGHYQNRSYRAAVTHRHLVCFAYALQTHLRIERDGAQGRRTRAKAADLSTAAAQDQLRGLLRGDLIIYLKAKATLRFTMVLARPVEPGVAQRCMLLSGMLADCARISGPEMCLTIRDMRWDGMLKA